ncbi:TFIIB-type zinc ribbon-containing protein [Sphaerisporangium corydalis]|uniref:Zf-TFIIB domain-containing protein n=1 Tax=Sphaerisporangium corydalis TaxID=1441875 RepID=A0ABV9EB34_9ACTN|nr:zf-TFIIB domain-containing protein [Sphaerisporangium corydalis]
MRCPKCQGSMRTYDRNGVHIDQCENCRGIFLDYGELETLSRVESQWAQQQYTSPPPAPHGGPAWGTPHHGGHRGGHHQRSWVGMLFSS